MVGVARVRLDQASFLRLDGAIHIAPFVWRLEDGAGEQFALIYVKISGPRAGCGGWFAQVGEEA